jgi:hypothetical protein
LRGIDGSLSWKDRAIVKRILFAVIGLYVLAAIATTLAEASVEAVRMRAGLLV